VVEKQQKATIHTLEKNKQLENAWQSLAYSPLGAIMSPLANTCEKHLLIT